MSATLKELLKPPFHCNDSYFKFDWEIPHIRCDMFDRDTAVIKIMPLADFGYYIKMLDGEEGFRRFIAEFNDFVVKALNNEWERVYGEPKRWKIIEMWEVGYLYECENCSQKLKLETDHPTYCISRYRYCSSCGVKLEPPEEQ